LKFKNVLDTFRYGTLEVENGLENPLHIDVRAGGAGGQLPPPKQITKSKSRANIQHKSGKKWENKKPKSPQFVVQIKVVEQYSLKSWAILAIYSDP
jgi:hypothetical protein